jgi:hypothetical protein
LYAFPRQGERRSVMSQLHTCPGPVASWTGAWRAPVPRLPLAGIVGRAPWSWMPAAMRHQERREASIMPSSHAAANAWSTELPCSQAAVTLAATASRSAAPILDG